jgi:hypothetical protein
MALPLDLILTVATFYCAIAGCIAWQYLTDCYDSA